MMVNKDDKFNRRELKEFAKFSKGNNHILLFESSAKNFRKICG